jgi:hypothetical protein
MLPKLVENTETSIIRINLDELLSEVEKVQIIEGHAVA